jgi:hypothetical protein
MSAKKSRQRPRPGDIVEIPFSDGRFGYGRVLSDPLMGFYEIHSSEPIPADRIVQSKILFKIWVMNSAVTSGRWKIIGRSPIESDLQGSPWFFKQDIISKDLTLYREGQEKPGSVEQCKGLERAAVWSAEHVESRLEDEIDGRPNKWVEMLRLEP